jgi:hypothetical protein
MSMFRFKLFLLSAGLLSLTLGCARTLQYTAGVCDCYPPPVEQLLVPPCAGVPAIPNSSVHAPLKQQQAPALPQIKPTQVLPKPEAAELLPVPPKPIDGKDAKKPKEDKKPVDKDDTESISISPKAVLPPSE